MHESLIEFKFRPEYHHQLQSYLPLHVWKIVVNILAPTFLIGSSSFFQVTRTTNKSGQSSNFSQIGPRDAELQPLINVRNWFLLNILRMDGQNLTKFCKHIIIDKICGCYSKASFFANLQQSYSPWMMSEIGFCSISWERMDRIQPNFVCTLS